MTTSDHVLAACKAGIKKWQDAFNKQDAAGCAAQYEADAVMNARPMGTFTGREAIQAFWQQIIDAGFADVNYTEVTWEQLNTDSFILSSQWTMNKAYGVVHKEVWRIQPSGEALLASDEFEILGER